jgi:hypothetical protein
VEDLGAGEGQQQVALVSDHRFPDKNVIVSSMIVATMHNIASWRTHRLRRVPQTQAERWQFARPPEQRRRQTTASQQCTFA